VTMPSGNGVTPQKPKPIERGQHVAPGPMSFEASRRIYNLPTGPVTMVVLRFETVTGTTELVMAPEFASTISQAAWDVTVVPPGHFDRGAVCSKVDLLQESGLGRVAMTLRTGFRMRAASNPQLRCGGHIIAPTMNPGAE